MAITNLSLGEHWELFIKTEISSGRYGSPSEVIRDALTALKERNIQLEALRSHLNQGSEQARSEHFVNDFSINSLIKDLDDEA